MIITSFHEEIEMITIACTSIMDLHKNHNLFVTVHTRALWVKPACPAEPKYLTPKLLMGALPATPTEPASSLIINQICSKSLKASISWKV